MNEDQLLAEIFQCFIDESSGIAPDGCFVLAGHIATSDTWAAFSRDWERLLPLTSTDRNGRHRFKMSELALSVGGMTIAERFARVIDQHLRLSISCSLNLGEFISAQRRALDFASGVQCSFELNRWANPYYFLFRGLLTSFHQAREQISDEIPTSVSVDFIFDDRSEKSFIQSAWENIFERMSDDAKKQHRFCPRFESDHDCPPLQAADFWSWWVREWREEDASNEPDKMLNFDFGRWKGVERRLISIAYDEELILKAFLAQLAENLTEGNIDPYGAAVFRGDI